MTSRTDVCRNSSHASPATGYVLPINLCACRQAGSPFLGWQGNISSADATIQTNSSFGLFKGEREGGEGEGRGRRLNRSNKEGGGGLGNLLLSFNRSGAEGTGSLNLSPARWH